jgi:hypothetical protein
MKTFAKITGIVALVAMLTAGFSTAEAQGPRGFRYRQLRPYYGDYYGRYAPYYRSYYGYYPYNYGYYPYTYGYYPYGGGGYWYYGDGRPGTWYGAVPNTYRYYYDGYDDGLYEYLVLRGLLREIL